jgi:hypothetical protein
MSQACINQGDKNTAIARQLDDDAPCGAVQGAAGAVLSPW